MIRYDFDGRAILLDIEGTTSALTFVHEVLFPYARHQLDTFLRARWTDPAVSRARDQIARDAGAESFSNWCGGDPAAPESRERLRTEVVRLMDADEKSTGLKELQGLIWEGGYRSGLLRSHIFPDVPPALCAWRAAGLGLRIYSSGSAAAQQLFFKHTVAGDLTRYIQGYYDTTVGPKRSASSYAAIAADMNLAPGELLFLSDVPAELDAARSAGLATALVERPGNALITENMPSPRVTFFGQVAPIRPSRPMSRIVAGATAAAVVGGTD